MTAVTDAALEQVRELADTLRLNAGISIADIDCGVLAHALDIVLEAALRQKAGEP